MIKTTGKEIEQMLLKGGILRAFFSSSVNKCGYEVVDGKVKFLNIDGTYDASKLITMYGDCDMFWHVIYPEVKLETIEIREPFKSFLDACEWLSDENNEYAYGKNGPVYSNYIGTFKELKSNCQTKFKVYNVEVKTKTVRYYVDGQGNEVEVKE